MARLRTGRLAAALALGTAAAVPTVVAFSEDPRALPRSTWAASGGAGGSVTAATSAQGPPAGAWSLSRFVEDLIKQVQQLGPAGTQLDEAAAQLHKGGAPGEAAATAVKAGGGASHARSSTANSQAADSSPTSRDRAQAAAHLASADGNTQQAQHHQGVQESQQQQQKQKQLLKFRTRVHDVSPSQLAVQHAEDMRYMRQLAAAELAALRASSACAAAQRDPNHHPNQEQQGQRQQGQQAQASVAAATERAQQQQQPQQREAQAPPPQTAPAQPPSSTADAAAATGALPPPNAGESVVVTKAQAPPLPLPLPPRFTDAELMRFAIMHGLLRAASEGEMRQALREGAAAAAATAEWLRDHPFSSEEELQRWEHLVSWQGIDSEGRPILRIAIGKAVSECRGSAALAFANAIITQMEKGVQEHLWNGEGIPAVSGGAGSTIRVGSTSSAAGSDYTGSSSSSGSTIFTHTGPGRTDAASSKPGTTSGSTGGSTQQRGPEQIVVVMDCSGASTFNAARISWVFKEVAATLNHHYPGRLHELVLLDLPVVLGWMVKGVQQLVHPDTRHKFRVLPHGQRQYQP